MKNLKLIYLFLVIAVASCLPQEKTTQCGSNEAYNATSRKCVAVLGASSASVNISNITPAGSYAVSTSDASKSHAVTVSDPNGYGFQIKWVLTLPSGGTTLLGTGLSMTFNHSTFSEGSYIVEVQLLNASGTEVFDSRSWTVRVIGETVPTISKITASPFTTTTTSSNTTINSTANNPDSISNINYQWYANGTAIAGETGTFSTTTQSLPFNFNPTSSSTYFVGAGVYTVQLILTENISGAMYNSETWTINNNIPNFASISLGTSATHSTTTPNSGSIITVINDTTINSSGFLYDVDGDTTLDGIDLCVKADDIAGVDGDGLYVDFTLDGNNIPGASNIKLTAANTSFCLESFNNYQFSIPPATVTESHSLEATVYDKYTGATNRPNHNGYAQVDKFTWTARVRQKNTPPIISITDAAIDPISCVGQTTTTYSTCSVEQNKNFNLAITVTDDDYDPEDYAGEYAKFRVQFYIEGSLMDGSDLSTHTLASHSDCYHDFSETATSSRYICSVTLNPYDANGPIDITGLSYTLKAKVTDSDSPYLVSATDSNEVSWLISSVSDTTTNSITVNQFAIDEAAHVANPYNGADVNDVTPAYSYISTTATPGTAITLNSGAVTEGETIRFHTFVLDSERDSHTIKVERCIISDCSTGVHVPDLVTSTTNSATAFAQKLTTLDHQIAEDEVIGATSALVGYRITVSDSDGATSQTDTAVLVNNDNPNPTFSAANFNPSVPSTLIGFTGFPISIDPGTISDLSTADGENITYQWMYSTNAGTNWAVLAGATSKVLAWSPGQELDYSTQTGTAVKLKLCIGDDGFNKLPLNGGSTDCLSSALDTSGMVAGAAWDVTVFSNMVQGGAYLENTTSNTSRGEVAVWIDPTSVDPVVKYMAYVGKNFDIIVEKLVTSSTGAKNGGIEKGTEELTSIEFPASTTTTTSATHLSIAGDATNGALYISYMSPVSSVDQVHVIRIDISGGKSGFIHDGKFGFDPGYDDLTNNIIVTSAGINTEVINSSGLTELTFTNSANAIAMAVNFNGIHGGSTDLIAGTNFCAPTSLCTTIASTATNFAAAINASAQTEIQGITAAAVGGVVTLSGAAEDEFLEADIGATKIGSIVVNQTSGKWVLPLIDSDLGAGDKNKIALLQGNLNVRLSQSGMIKTTLSNTTPSQDVANDIDANDVMIIATKESISGDIGVYEVDANLTQIDTETDFFTVGSISNLKVAVSKESAEFDPSAFITGTNSNDRLAFARIDSSGGNYNLSTATIREDLDSGFELLFDLNNYDITAGGEEYQLLVGVVADQDFTGATDGVFKSYLLNITGSSPIIDCSYDGTNPQDPRYCMQLFTNSSDNIFDLEIALGDVLEDVAIGTDGSVVGENTKDIIPYVFHKDDGGGSIADDALPILGLINVSGTTLSGDNTSPGTGYIMPYVSP